MCTITNQEKSRVIAEKLGIYYSKCDVTDMGGWAKCTCGKSWKETEFETVPYMSYACGHMRSTSKDRPDFFTPDGQAVLAGALWENDTLGKNFYIAESFLAWLKEQPIHNKNGYHLFHIIAETKLAELFYEFIESEGKKK